MLTIHKAELFNTVDGNVPLERVDYEIRDIEEIEITDCFVIKITGTPLEFMVSQDPNDFDKFGYSSSAFKPGWEVNLSQLVCYKNDIDTVSTALSEWIYDVVDRYFEDVEIDDPWEKLQQYQRFIPSHPLQKENLQPFSPVEKEQIRNSLLVFKQLVYKKYRPDEAQKEFIEERLTYLSKAVDRLNRFDWKGLAISVIVGIGINLSVDTESGKALLKLFEQAFLPIRYFLE